MTDLSPAMIRALQILATRRTSITIEFSSIHAGTVKALERRGLVTVEKRGLGSYGWNRVKINKAGRKYLADELEVDALIAELGAA